MDQIVKIEIKEEFFAVKKEFLCDDEEELDVANWSFCFREENTSNEVFIVKDMCLEVTSDGEDEVFILKDMCLEVTSDGEDEVFILKDMCLEVTSDGKDEVFIVKDMCLEVTSDGEDELNGNKIYVKKEKLENEDYEMKEVKIEELLFESEEGFPDHEISFKNENYLNEVFIVKDVRAAVLSSDCEEEMEDDFSLKMEETEDLFEAPEDIVRKGLLFNERKKESSDNPCSSSNEENYNAECVKGKTCKNSSFSSSKEKLDSSRYERSCSSKADLNVQPLKPPYKKVFPCESCDKIFERQSSLTLHMKIHYGKRKLKSEQNSRCKTLKKNCLKSQKLPQRDSIKYVESSKQNYYDLRNQTQNKNLIACPICNRGFVQRRNLKIHMLIHSDSRPFGCPLCKKSYVLKNRLYTHFQAHSKEKPISCNVCRQTFFQKRKSHLNAHMLIHAKK